MKSKKDYELAITHYAIKCIDRNPEDPLQETWEVRDNRVSLKDAKLYSDSYANGFYDLQEADDIATKEEKELDSAIDYDISQKIMTLTTIYKQNNITPNCEHETLAPHIKRYGIGLENEHGRFIVFTGSFNQCYARYKLKTNEFIIVDADSNKLTTEQINHLNKLHAIPSRSLYDTIKDGNKDEADEIASQTTFRIY